MAEQNDFSQGSVTRHILSLALPMTVAQLVQILYNVVDRIYIGHLPGASSLALTGLGLTFPVVTLILAFTNLFGMGGAPLCSIARGRDDIPRAEQIMGNTLTMLLASSVVLTVLGYLLLQPLLYLFGASDETYPYAAAYLRINFVTAVCPLFYYLFSSVFRGMGDSRTALCCLVIAALGNVGLDVLFVAVFHWGVAGTAWATALAQALSALFAAVLLWRRYPEVRLRRADLAFDRRMFGRITGLALPIALQSAFNNLSNVVAQSGVNTFGETVMAAYTAASRIGTLALMPVETIASSLSVYAGQNHGAGKLGRIRQGIRAALLLSLGVSAAMAALLLAGGGALARLFLTDPSAGVLAVVQHYLLIAAAPGFLDGVMCIFQQTLRGVDRPNQALAGGLMQLAAKIAAVAAGAWLLHDLDVVWLGWPLSFAAGTVVPFLCCRRYLREAEGQRPLPD